MSIINLDYNFPFFILLHIQVFQVPLRHLFDPERV